MQNQNSRPKFLKGQMKSVPGTFVFTNDSTAIYPTINTNAPVRDEEYRIHTVVRGDTLWDISAKHLGKGSRYPEIKKLNGLTSSVICFGWKLKILT